MTNRERAMAVLNYKNYDRLPIVHFGFWGEALVKWVEEGHLKLEEIEGYSDGSPAEKIVIEKLGFDFNWQPNYGVNTGLWPGFESKVIEELPDGFKKVLSSEGNVYLERAGAGSIPSIVDYLLKGRKEWEDLYLPKLQFFEGRASKEWFAHLKDDRGREYPVALGCGSLFGYIRNWIGIAGVSYLYADDEALFTEIIDHLGNLTYKCVELALASGAKFDYGHFWEDICFKNGPLISPKVFEEKVGPHYKRITGLLNQRGIKIVSLDCDGMIDALIPTWIKNGVNTMFPIEVGTWNANLAPWREKYGKELRGVGGMNKHIFALDYAAVDTEIERLKPLVALGGFIPCPDHRIPPTAEWENIQYYCDRMRKTFG